MDKILSNIKLRVLQYLENKKLKKEGFFENTGISASNFKGTGLKSELSGDKIAKILTIYSDLNSEWLLMGEGEMLKFRPINDNNDSIKHIQGQLRESRDKLLTTNISKDSKLSGQQSKLLFKNNDKVQAHLENLTDDLKGLYTLVENFETFRDGVAKEISEAYFEKLYDIVFDDGVYLDGNKYRLEDCKKDAYAELAKLKPLQEPLKNIDAAISKFYKEFNQVDTKKVIVNSIGPHVI